MRNLPINRDDINLWGLSIMTTEQIIRKIEKRIEILWTDIQNNHVSRVVDGINKKYADENQSLVLFDHLTRIRVYTELVEDLKRELARSAQYQEDKTKNG